MRGILDIIFGTVVDPRTAAEKVIALRLSDLIVVQAALLVSICSTILTYFFLKIIAKNVTGKLTESTILLNEVLSYISDIQPMYFTANQIFQMIVFSIIITFGGRLFNGKGKFFEALICITMVEAILIVLKFLQLVLLPFSASLAFLILIPGVLWSFWAFASSAAVIHGFRSTVLTLSGGLALCVLFILSLNLLF